MLNKCSSLLYHLRVDIGFEDHPDHLWIPKEDSSPNLACIYSFCLNSFSYSHWLLPDLLDFDKAVSFIKLMVSVRWAICFLFHPYSDLGFAFWIHINLVLHTPHLPTPAHGPTSWHCLDTSRQQLLQSLELSQPHLKAQASEMVSWLKFH